MLVHMFCYYFVTSLHDFILLMNMIFIVLHMLNMHL
jgi:hypothetical protein